MTKKPNAAAVAVEEMYEAGVIDYEMVTSYRDKDRAFTECCERHSALLDHYAGVRAGGTLDETDRRFAIEALKPVLEAQRELAVVARLIQTVVQAAYQTSLTEGEP